MPVRQARADDFDAVAAFTDGTWSDHGVDDYIADVFTDWVAGDGQDQRTVVATVDDTPVGVCQAHLLADDEAWLQGIRVAPDHRGDDHGEAMVAHLLSWCRDHGATVARNLVFGWNGAGMGQSRAVGFDPVTTCRFLELTPETDAAADANVVDDATAAWRFWTHSDARDHLSGLARADDHAWALSELDRARLDALAENGRAFALVDGGTRAMTVRIGTREREGETVAEYAVAAWATREAATDLLAAIRADAAACAVDAARVLVPDTPQFVSDAATTRCRLSDTTEYIFAADLTEKTSSSRR
jgi:GNAT superfamily N-acetyltransferase